MKPKNILIEVLSSLVMLLFLYAAISKLLSFYEFKQQMYKQPFNRAMVPLLIYGLPTMEILVALFLISDRTRKVGFIGSLLLLASFTIYIILIKAKAFSHIPCSCGGIISQLKWTGHLILNLSFLAVTIAGLYLFKTRISTPERA
jgi:putative oxidoreductase